MRYITENFRSCNQCNRPRYDVIRTQGAIIEDISMNNRTGYVTISYGVIGAFQMIHKKVIVLLVNQNTIIKNQFNRNMLFRDLKVGMIIDAEYSRAMTRSMPPQAMAYRIMVVGAIDEPNVKIGRVLSVDLKNSFFVTGEEDDLNSQMRFVVTNSTLILNRRGDRILLNDLQNGQMVRVEHASFQTASIPPQTTAFLVQVV